MITFDEFGPEKIIIVHDAKAGMRGFVVIDNTALGPGKGGIRMTPTVTEEEVARLARAMTWKTALSNLPFGGAKAGIVADPRQITKKKKEELIRSFSRALKDISPKRYIAAPDMNIAEEEIGWYVDENGDPSSATGKPASGGGLPHELGSTGFGVFHATRVAARSVGIDLKKATIAIEGFGNVGRFAATHLAAEGAKIVAVSDSRGVAHVKEGMDMEKLFLIKDTSGSVVSYPGALCSACQSILDIQADILVTAAIPDLIRAGDVDRLKHKIIVEGSNIPMTADVEELCHMKGILVVPDVVANAGGVISSFVEYQGGNEEDMFRLVEKTITENTRIVLERARKNNRPPRAVALDIAKSRVREKCRVCSV